jgi:hypothetical protein
VATNHKLCHIAASTTGAKGGALEHNGASTHAGVAFIGKEFELIDKFVKHNGAGQWKRKELNVLADAIKAGVGSRWEDVHGAGSSDGNWTTSTTTTTTTTTTKKSFGREL